MKIKEFIRTFKGTIIYWMTCISIVLILAFIFNPKYENLYNIKRTQQNELKMSKDIYQRLDIKVDDTLNYFQTKKLAVKIDEYDKNYKNCLKIMNDLQSSYEGLIITEWKDVDNKKYYNLKIRLNCLKKTYNDFVYIYNKTMNDHCYKNLEFNQNLPTYFNYK